MCDSVLFEGVGAACDAPYHRIVSLKGAGQFDMRVNLPIAIILAGGLAAAPGLFAQAPAPASSGDQKQTSAPSPKSGAESSANGQTPASQSGGNPFPEDEGSVPVLPSRNSANIPPDLNGASGGGRVSLPANDSDPVRSPDEPATATGANQGSSSSLNELGGLLSGPDDEQPTGGKNKHDQVIETMPRETPKEDISVGNYYLDIKDWRGALSRFQSALVLAPENPDVYWGLAECQRHLGDFTDARANYIKVMVYDPGSHHAKEAKKALEDPEIANAKPTPAK